MAECLLQKSERRPDVRHLGNGSRGLAAREKGDEATRLYEAADKRFAEGYSIAPDQTEIACNRAEVLFWRSRLESGEKQRELLLRVCGQCAELASKRVGGARMLETWGGALVWLGAQAKGPEAERLYTEAEQKLSQALVINPASRLAETGRVHAMLWRAVFLRGQARQELLERVCQDCLRLNAADSKDAELLRMWGAALGWQGVAAEGETAGRLFSEAAEKFSLAVAIKPGDKELVIGLAGALYYHARVCDPEEGRALITRASDLLEAASRETSGYAALSWWATVLALRGKLLPGEETDHLLKEAAARFDAAKQNGVDPDALLRDRPMLVWAQAVSEAAKVQ